ncbi:HAD family hydrolase [Streptomyces sp. NBC_00083]|uniref:HAD family hydrolase n=1 Tax=Streptomyces sp. NBC_00083 TaxID=2975647 RepID=UPI00225AAE5A|nr:HAD family hydrolase [Streptomyces sp. NBC_00083]MCX5384267.1 HAD family hydrolase [Streptomyces sp. NBC_00083]
MAQVRVLALDFVGTLAGHGPAPDGRLVADVLRTLPGSVVPDAFAGRFDGVTRRFRLTDQARGVRTPFTARLRRAAHDCGAVVPDLRLAVEAVFMAVPDARVDPRAAQALRTLAAGGLSCVLASNTDRPHSVRLRTLRTAGIADCFDALVLSSTLGLRKPDPRFYAAVTRAAGCPPEDILFVGDNPENDATAPHAFGMSAVLITALPRPAALPAAIATLRHVGDLVTHLNRLRRQVG